MSIFSGVFFSGMFLDIVLLYYSNEFHTELIHTGLWITQWDNEELNYFLYRKNTWFNSTVLIKKSNRRTWLSNSVVKALATPVWEPELGSLRSHVKDDRIVLLSCWCSCFKRRIQEIPRANWLGWLGLIGRLCPNEYGGTGIVVHSQH